MKYDSNGALLQSEIPSLGQVRRGKVRDIYDLGDSLLFVASDRISAFDCVLPNGIPDKGRVLTSLSLFWLDFFPWMPNHLITADIERYPESLRPFADHLQGRSMIVKKAEPLCVECIARGYIIGSGWKDYQKSGKVCGIPLRVGYQQAEKLDEPIFTPSTKAEQGLHDENISFEKACGLVGAALAAELREKTLAIYKAASEHAASKGIILADTKFEFGMLDGELILIDEVLTPDSSRFWPGDEYKVGCSPPSLDKQYVRDYLESLDWDKSPPAPELPQEVVLKVRDKYIDALRRISGKSLSL
ncbi:MAG: phosphoribosylaminoimidazolesuccinocarboxamide synthase [Victivallales bacterium]|nr:phosphoribosylaminoimidazolesuccinocarboxamide synthase [Victivallales bacterium]